MGSDLQIDDRKAAVTIVGFAGLASPNHVLEWSRSVKEFAANFIAVRDAYDCWYQHETEKLRDRIAASVDSLKTQRLVFVGHSAGGFAALLFGKMLGADRIVAFSPQTVCGKGLQGLGDDRWPGYTARTPGTQYSDLAGAHPRAEIHYAEDSRLDVLHALRIAPEWRIAYPEGGHRLPHVLRGCGVLKTILSAAIAGGPYAPSVTFQRVA